MPEKKYYAYTLPDNRSAVVTTWAECEAAVKGQKGARYKAFKSREEAKEWLSGGALYGVKKELPKGIYFDAGTGRGEGVEISVTDNTGTDLLSSAMPKDLINVHGKHLLPKGKTNNYGELLACFYALQIARNGKLKNIFGDSALVIDYWSKGFIKKEVGPETIDLAKKVALMRREFEAAGGKIERVSGDDNPADLGFH